MKLVQRKNINEDKWAEWCDISSESQPFLSLLYLDAVSEKLVFALNDDETGGIPLPFFERLGVKTLYTPVFCRWIDWVGNDLPEPGILEAFLKAEFNESDIYFRRSLLKENASELIYQKVTKDKFKLNSQAKRKVKSIEKENFEITVSRDVKSGLELIRKELSGKFETLHDDSFDSLEVLLCNLNSISELRYLYLLNSGEVEGVLFLVQTNETMLYLKGTCSQEAKNKGGMYALMNAAILDAFESNRTFDFGGSRIDGVRRFNKCFGGQDTVYFQYKWSNSPLWYKAAKSLKNKWRKK